MVVLLFLILRNLLKRHNASKLDVLSTKGLLLNIAVVPPFFQVENLLDGRKSLKAEKSEMIT